MPGRITELSETQIIADLLKAKQRQAQALAISQTPQPAKDTLTITTGGAPATWQLNAIPYQGAGGSSLNLSLNGVELLEGVDYTVDYTTAIVTFSSGQQALFKATPTPADVLTADYWTTGDLIAATGPADTGLVTSGLIQHLEFDSITDSDGALLTSTIADVTGNGYTMAAVGGMAPTVKRNFLNGHTALQFSGAQAINGARSVADDFTIIQVFKAGSLGGQDSYYNTAQDLYNTEVAGQAADFGTSIGTADFVAGQGSGPDVMAFITTPAMSLTPWHVAVMERTKGSSSPPVNTQIRTFRDTTGTTPLATWSANIGYSNSLNASATAAIGATATLAAAFFTGYYACLLVYNRVLTDAERAIVVAWCQSRYGI